MMPIHFLFMWNGLAISKKQEKRKKLKRLKTFPVIELKPYIPANELQTLSETRLDLSVTYPEQQMEVQKQQAHRVQVRGIVEHD